MKPPEETNIIDKHGGFTIEEKMPYYAEGIDRFDMQGRQDYRPRGGRTLPIGDTLWKPSKALKRGTTGTLLAYDESSFYQNNNNVTVAIYRVPGYRFPIILWFDNRSGERIA